MNPEQLYDILQQTLADENFRAEMIGRISARAASDLPGQTELFPREDTLALSAENAELSRALQNENSALAARIRSLQASLDRCISVYGMQMSLYERFKALSVPVAAAVKGYFKNPSPAGLFLCGVQPDNLKGFRDYTERLVFGGTSPVYVPTEVRPGDVFDPALHHNIGLAKSGRITAVRLQGCTAANTGKVIRKAVVEI